MLAPPSSAPKHVPEGGHLCDAEGGNPSCFSEEFFFIDNDWFFGRLFVPFEIIMGKFF